MIQKSGWEKYMFLDIVFIINIRRRRKNTTYLNKVIQIEQEAIDRTALKIIRIWRYDYYPLGTCFEKSDQELKAILDLNAVI